MRQRSGLTLVELLVVLAILAVLTTVAVSLTDSVVDQGRFDVTQRTLDNIQNAVLGPANQVDADGTRALGGFIADVGRPPLAVGIDPTTQLAELWSNPRGLRAFGPATPASDPNVLLLVGWRGPYLRLPSQTAALSLRDGWGNPFNLLKSDLTTPVGPDEAIVYVTSQGGPASPYNIALTTTIPLSNYLAVISGAVTDADPTTAGAADVTVRLFHADVTSATGLAEKTVTAKQAEGYAFKFENVPMGPQVLRAYQGTRKSDILHLRVPPGGLSRNILLDIQ